LDALRIGQSLHFDVTILAHLLDYVNVSAEITILGVTGVKLSE
jgi:hypothetical protein